MAIWIRTDGIIETVSAAHMGAPFNEKDIRRHVGGSFETINLKDGEVLYHGKAKGRDDNKEATKYAEQHGWNPEDGQPLHGNVVVLRRGETLATEA